MRTEAEDSSADSESARVLGKRKVTLGGGWQGVSEGNTYMRARNPYQT